jgi:hypothetical protein
MVREIHAQRVTVIAERVALDGRRAASGAANFELSGCSTICYKHSAAAGPQAETPVPPLDGRKAFLAHGVQEFSGYLRLFPGVSVYSCLFFPEQRVPRPPPDRQQSSAVEEIIAGPLP